MRVINRIHEGGDPVEFLIVVWDSMFDPNGFFDLSGILTTVDYYMRAAGRDDEFISKIDRIIEETLENMFGPFNFLYDYCFSSESPIPAYAY
jgi:hypothetical protein